MNESTTEHTTIVEVNGIKMEVDLRTARRVGDPVKLLLTGGYGSPEVVPGVIVDFEEFQSLPTIVVAYVKSSFSDASWKGCWAQELCRI